MATRDDSEIPESGAVFTFGKSKFADNNPNKFWVKNDKVLQIDCGDEHTALIAETGRVFMFGPNDWGQLGLGDDNKGVNKPSCIKSLKQENEKAKLVACGRSHTIISTYSGHVYSFGSNSEGQLGIPGITTSHSPKRVGSLPVDQFKILAAGSDSSVVLTEDGKVYVWGGNDDGILGLGEESSVPEPKILPIERPVLCIACGYYHTALVTDDGKLYTMGESADGKLGLRDDVGETNVPQEVADIPSPVKWVSCGSNHTVALTEFGEVYVFGEGESGQLGLGTEILSCSKPSHLKLPFTVSQVCCGQAFTALISEKGQLYTFGDGRYGKLAHGSDHFSNQFKPFHCKRFSKFIVDKVACGGCHMIVTARPKALNGGLEEEDDDRADEMLVEKLALDATNSIGSPSLSRTLSARERRRDEVQRSFSSMNQTLPPLGHNRALPSLSATMPALKSSPGKVNGDLHNGKLSNHESADDEFEEEKNDPLTKARMLSHPKASPRRTLPPAKHTSSYQDPFKPQISPRRLLASKTSVLEVKTLSSSQALQAKISDDENATRSGSEGDAENDDFMEEEEGKTKKRKKDKKAKHRKKKESPIDRVEVEEENLESQLSKALSQQPDSEPDDGSRSGGEESKLSLERETDDKEEENKEEVKEVKTEAKADDSWEESAEDRSPLSRSPIPVPRKKKEEEKASDLEMEEEMEDEVHSENQESDREKGREKTKTDKELIEEFKKSAEESEKENEKSEEGGNKKKGKKDKNEKTDKKDKKKNEDDEKEKENEEEGDKEDEKIKEEKEEKTKEKDKKKDKKDKKKDKGKDKKKGKEEIEEEEDEEEDEKANKKSKDKKKDKKKDKEKDKKKKDKKGKGIEEEDEKEEEEDEEKDKDKEVKDKKKDKKEDKKKGKDKKNKDENGNTERGTTKKSRTCTIL